jgi:two-component system, sensor histidine kinase and response regulator
VHVFANEPSGPSGPDARVPPDATGAPAQGTPMQSASVQRLRGARILLTEDNEINQQIAIELLQESGAIVEVANNGREAVDILSGGGERPRFDMVLMDLQMPEMDGFQATARLRADHRFATLPIIAMTAHATTEERQRCLAAGMNDHIAKPIDPDHLIATVARFHRNEDPRQEEVQGQRRPDTDTPTNAAAADDLLHVEGLDARDGLSRVGGNRVLYRRLLCQFIDRHGGAVAEAADALAAGDIARAERAAHSLKGVAGNIGAIGVQATAARLEQLLRDRAPAPELDAARRDAAAELDRLVARLSFALDGDGGGPESRPATSDTATIDMAAPPPARCSETAAQLTTLLSDFDPSAANFLDANRAALKPLFADATWAQFEQHVLEYAFGEAREELEQAVQHFSAG